MSAPSYGSVPGRGTSSTILIVVGVLFAIPLVALLIFTFRNGTSGFTFAHYAALTDPVNQATYEPLFQGLVASLVIALLTVAIVLLILLPAQIITSLKYPRLRRIVEFVCLIPITVPTVVLVVGFVPVYSIVSQIFGSGSWTLCFAVGIISLPYAFRPIAANIAAVEMVLLSEAARSLGAGWGTVVWRVLLPNLRRGILSACFLTVTVVLGEYTIASFLSRNTFQTALVLVQQTDPYVAGFFSLAALVFGFLLLVVIGRIGSGTPGGRRRGRAAAREQILGATAVAAPVVPTASKES
jgi:putative spermidine/putrescine transport system permease protein